MDITITIEDTLFTRLASTYDITDPFTHSTKLGTIDDIKTHLLGIALERIKSIEGEQAARTAIAAVRNDVDAKQVVVLKGV